jgi:molecular chaperone DnaJ
VLPDVPADPAPESGGDLHGEVTLSFEEALRGAVRQLNVTRLDACAVCGGSGARRAAERGCAACQGSGSRQWRRGHMLFSKTCAECGGSGRQRRRPCTACAAAGTATVTEEIRVQVPAGVADGARLRVPGKGNAGPRGGAAGDLYITTCVASHRLFRREGDDLALEVPIGVHEAALGADIRIPTIDGSETLRVPPGTQSGARLRLPARGIPSRAGARGDLIAEVRIVVPQPEDERSRELLREWGRLNPAAGLRKVFAE